jgi:hypothetical protein
MGHTRPDRGLAASRPRHTGNPPLRGRSGRRDVSIGRGRRVATGHSRRSNNRDRDPFHLAIIWPPRKGRHGYGRLRHRCEGSSRHDRDRSRPCMGCRRSSINPRSNQVVMPSLRRASIMRSVLGRRPRSTMSHLTAKRLPRVFAPARQTKNASRRVRSYARQFPFAGSGCG